MAGQVKRKYNSETGKYMKRFTSQLNKIQIALPYEYDDKLILKFYKKYYSNQWKELISRYEYYNKKDKHLLSVGKKKEILS